MLSYMLPVEDKSASSSPSARNLNLSLNLNATTAPGASTGANMGGIAAGPMTNGNSLDPSCDENAKLLSSELAHNIKNAPRDLKLDNGIIKMSQTNQKPPLPTQNGDHDAIGGTTEDSSCADTDSKSAPTATKKSTGKLNKTGTKNVTLKRVSFGSSKGSMVETLVFETPTPLPEHAEREFGFPAENYPTVTTQHYNSGGNGGGGGGGMFGFNVGKMINNNNYNHSNNNNSSCLDDSGIEMQEELERSKVRVTFFQSSKPQQVSPPESYINFTDSSLPLLTDSFITDTSTLSESTMTAATATQPTYDRQISTESGWDNPFRPGGDLSREADEIVNMIKGGKPITPTGDPNHSIANGNAQKDTGNHAIENGQAVVDGATKKEVSHVQSTIPAQNGTKSPQQNSTAIAANKANGDTKTATAPQTQVSNQVIPGPISASHVVIEDKKKKKCTCCVIQ